MRKCHVTKKTIFESLTHLEFFMQVGDRRQVLRSYFCDHCNGYHVTSMSVSKANKYLGAQPLKHSEQFKKYMK